VLTNPGTVQTTWISYLTARTGVAQATNVTTNVGGVNFGHGTNFYNRACAAGSFFKAGTEFFTVGRGSQNTETNTTWANDTYSLYYQGNAQFSFVGSNAFVGASTNAASNTVMVLIRFDHRGLDAPSVISNVDGGGVLTNADTAFIWFNPTNLTLEPSTNTAQLSVVATAYGNNRDFAFNRIRPFAGGKDANGAYGSMDMDEIRMGTNYFDVAPLNCVGASFATNPASITKPEFTSATFSVYANGSTPTYQWQATNNAGGWTNISSATSSNYTKSSLVLGDDQSKYRCIASVACNSSSATSSVATLTVIACTSASVTTSPTNITIGAGLTATFNVVAGGAQPTYQWQVSGDNGATFTNVTTGTGATTASYTTIATTFGANQSNQFRAIISVACNSSSATSAPALLTLICTTAGITTSPSSTTVLATSNATFTVVASGTSPTYQWQNSTDNGSTWSALSGATNASYTRTTVTADNASQYRVIVSVSCDSSSATSGVATLTVANPAASSFRSAATGNWNANATWELSTDNGSTWAAAPGTPDFNNSTNIAIRNGHTVSATAAVTVDDLTVNSGGILQASGGLVTFTNLGAPTDIFGSLRVANVNNSAFSTNSTTNFVRFQSGGSFVWNLQATATVPLAAWNDGSSCLFSNSATGTADITGVSGQNFYDVLLFGISASARPRFNITTNTVIRHDLTIILPDFASSTMGILSGANANLTVGNNVSITTGTTANSTKVLINNSAATVGIFKIGGNLTVNGNIDGFGTSSLLWEFNKTGAQSFFVLDPTNVLTPAVMTYQVDSNSLLTLLQDVTNVAAFNVLNGGTLDAGSKVITGTGFTLNSGASIRSAHASGLNGNIAVSSPTLSTGANYTFNGTAAQSAGALLPTSVNNFNAANIAGVSLVNDLSVAGTLGLSYTNGTPSLNVPTTKTLTLNNNATTVTVSGTALGNGAFVLASRTGSGSVIGTAGALTLAGSGAVSGAGTSLAISGSQLVLNVSAATASNVTYSRGKGVTLKIKKADLLAAGSVPSGQTATLSFSSATANSVSVTSNATYIFVPAETIADSFTYTITASGGSAATASVTINVADSTGQTTVSIDTSGGNPTLAFFGIPGYSYTIQVSTNLSTWTDVTTVTAGSTGVITYTDSAPPTPAAYYRTRYNP
jgi:hypothetical protein